MTQTGTNTSLRPISEIKLNPKNPRIIRDAKFANLVKSLRELPVMTSLREIIVDENDIIIGGNMRFRAAQEAGWAEVPVKVFTREMAEENNRLTGREDSYEDYKKEIVIRDNVSGGEWDWDMLSSDWEVEELEDWGMDLPELNLSFGEDKEIDTGELLDAKNTIECPKCHFEFEK